MTRAWPSRTRAWRASWSAVALTALLASAASAQRCPATAHDCAREDAAFRRRARALARRHPEVADAVEALRLRRLAWCHDRRACGIDEPVLLWLRQWSDNELDGLERASGATERVTWARSLPRRVAVALQASGALEDSVAPPALPDDARAQIRAHVARLEMDATGLGALESVLARLAAPGDEDVCRAPNEESLRQLVRQGGAAAGYAQALLRGLRDYCAPLRRHADPDETLCNRMRRFSTHLTRIEGWLRDILRCVQPGPYDGRCTNAYGPRRADTEDQARAALRLVEEVRRAVDGIPERPFPCQHPIWARLEMSQWTLGTARAQMPSLAREARALCASIGIEPAEREQARRLFTDQVERTAAMVAEQLRSTREALARFRRLLGEGP